MVAVLNRLLSGRGVDATFQPMDVR